MVTVVASGIAVVDFVMRLDAMPMEARKYRAADAAIVGGGCAAGAAVAVARLGGHALLATRLGEDPVGAMIAAGLAAEGIDPALVRRLPGCRSSFSSVLVDAAGERMVVNFRDPDMPGEAGWLADGLPPFDAAVADTRWAEGALVLMQAARGHGVPGVMDGEAPMDGLEPALEAASHIVFSAQGLRAFACNDDLARGLAMAGDRFGGWVAVTDGAAGCLWVEDGALTREPGFAVPVVDTLGAGDVWHGAFTLALGEGRPERAAARFANAVAAIKCGRFGGREGTPTRAEVDRFLKERS